MTDIKYDLTTKRRLSFGADGKFRILMMSDVQERANFDPDTLNCVEKLIDHVNPDLIVFGGDNVYGPDVPNEEEFEKFLETFTMPMEKRNIPWAHIFGNHDHDLTFDPYIQQAAYERYDTCVSKHTEGIGGVTNFVLPIYRHDSDKIAFNVWGLDTNQGAGEFLCKHGVEGHKWLEKAPVGQGCFGMPDFDQLMWYWNTSVAMEKHNGEKIPALMCMHVAPYEYMNVSANPEQCDLIGTYYEGLGPGPFNSGIFAEILQRGDVRCICCGHTHQNDFEATYCGVKLCFDATAGLTCYGDAATRGGRVFDLVEDDAANFTTHMVHYADLSD